MGWRCKENMKIKPLSRLMTDFGGFLGLAEHVKLGIYAKNAVKVQEHIVKKLMRDNKNTDEDWLEQIALKEAMARLSERERQILALRYSDGKTQMEVSSEIGISQAQVSRLEKNAIKSIKKNM